MSENVYSKVLAQLVAGEGCSTQAVASLLNVPEKTLERWMLGRSQMPLRAFLRALELVVQHEQRDGTLGPSQPAPEPLRFHAGPLAAARSAGMTVSAARIRSRGRLTAACSPAWAAAPRSRTPT